jgi:hypothetical protein
LSRRCLAHSLPTYKLSNRKMMFGASDFVSEGKQQDRISLLISSDSCCQNFKRDTK